MQVLARGSVVTTTSKSFTIDAIVNPVITTLITHYYVAILNRFRLLSVAINHAQSEWGWRLNNPVTGRTLAEPEGRARWITQAEAQTLIEAAEAKPQATHYLPDFIRLAINTGMRRGELLGLEWNRVDFSANLIYLAGMYTKSGKHRSIPIMRAHETH
ncbi:MAG: tyrosine-type recombinase/integrase [Candidatus Competibacteraceae bacterium]|nr:tyrosine-type recombinase/integrase [Candidatus Competibacteraceae bacterium]